MEGHRLECASPLALWVNSKRAAQTSVMVLRVFVRLRQMPASNAELARSSRRWKINTTRSLELSLMPSVS